MAIRKRGWLKSLTPHVVCKCKALLGLFWYPHLLSNKSDVPTASFAQQVFTRQTRFSSEHTRAVTPGKQTTLSRFGKPPEQRRPHHPFSTASPSTTAASHFSTGPSSSTTR